MSVGAQYATGDQWKNNSRKNEGTEPKQKEYPAVDVTGVQTCALPIWSWWRVLTECGPLEKGMANHFSILALRTHEQ